jgi:hypothetical protein
VHASSGSAFDRSEQDERTQSGRSVGKGRKRDPLAHRRRWILLAAVVVGWAGVVAGVRAPDELESAGQAEAAPAPEPKWTVSQLSEGAPAGAVTLADAPVTSGSTQPAAATVVNGLAANGIPTVALNAYRVAAARMGTAQPDCGIHWSLLAGIGRVESNHGRFGGAVLHPDGTSSPEIRGPALNGVDFAYIGDSDNGVFDHDSSYDRAVGPMQFIPTTWRSYAIDADGNHTTDPFDIDDAALGAAHYLCVAGGDLTTLSGQREAVLAYNHSDSYVAQVLALAHAYASGIPVDSMPLMGNVVSPVPPPTGHYLAPAAPGPAIGARDTTPASGPTVTPRGSAGRPAGGGGGGTAAGQPATPAGSPGGGTDPATTDGTGPATGPNTAPGQPAPEPAQPPAPAPANQGPTPPLPNAPLPQVPPPPPPLVPQPPPLAPGQPCTDLDVLGRPLLPNLPVCP